jgi:hypothetical protein
MQELKFMPFNRTSSLSRSPSRPGQNESLLHANRSSAAHMDQLAEASEDPKGRLIRILRLNLELDPAELATQACISVAQLYEIEQGLSTRFYSNSLREQAARRVAKLLNSDWDTLEESALSFKGNNKVVQLQWPLGSKPSAPLGSLDKHLVSDPAHMTALPPDQPIALSLSTPCKDQDFLPSQNDFEASQMPAKSARKGTGFLWSTVILLLGTLMGYALAEWSPYELVWPTKLAWPFSQDWPYEFVWPKSIPSPFST